MGTKTGTQRQALKWWGWGLEGEKYALKDPQNFWSYLEQTLGPLTQAPRIASLNDIPLAPVQLNSEALASLRDLFGEKGVSTDGAVRVAHALGKSYVDLIRIRQGRVQSAPDAVVFPEQEEQILAVLQEAAVRGWVIVPFGGGTSVVGGVEPLSGDRPVLTLDLGRMNHVLSIDRTSHTARLEAGIRGPELEAKLNATGLSLGHFPQSFEFSTLGGWIATRSAGQESTKYGKIENMVVSLRMVTPGGVLDSPVVPMDAAGPSLRQCLIGSEGTLGVIIQAVVRCHPLPSYRSYGAYLFPDFYAGMNAVKNMLQADLRPAILRLSDPDETAMARRLSQTPHASLKQRLGHWYVRRRGFDFKHGALLILVFEGKRDLVSAARHASHNFLKSGLPLGEHPARMWVKSRFYLPYLRDELLDRSIMVDTLETAAQWEKLPGLYAEVRQTLSESILKTAPGALVLTHLSHAYPDGASLYVTFLARQQTGQELAQWQAVKEAATDAILKHGGALSHHHGIGSMHKPWMCAYLKPEGQTFLRYMKEKLDPENIMNPGKLLGH